MSDLLKKYGLADDEEVSSKSSVLEKYGVSDESVQEPSSSILQKYGVAEESPEPAKTVPQVETSGSPWATMAQGQLHNAANIDVKSGKAALEGTKDWLPVMAVRAAADKLEDFGIKTPTVYDPEYEADSAVEKTVQVLSSFMDPAGFGVITKGSKLLGVTKAVQKATQKLHVAEELVRLGNTTIKNEHLHKLASQLYRSQAISNIINGGVTGMAYSTTREALSQVLEDEYSLSTLGFNALAGGTFGAGVGAVLSKLSRPRKLPSVEAIRESVQNGYGALDPSIPATIRQASGKPPVIESPVLREQRKVAVEKAWADAEKDVEKIMAKIARRKPNLDNASVRARFLAKRVDENFANAGIVRDPTTVRADGLISDLMNQLEWANAVDKNGTDLLGAVDAAIEATYKQSEVYNNLAMSLYEPLQKLEAAGVNPHLATDMLRYIETLPTGEVWFNKAANTTGRNLRPDWVGPELEQFVPEVKENLFKLRSVFNDVFTNYPELAEDMASGFVQGYIPLIPKTSSAAAPIPGSAERKINEVFMLKSRMKNTGFNPDIHETDAKLLARAYAKSVANHVAFKETLPKLSREYLNLRLLGLDDQADRWARYTARVLGMREPLAAKKLFADTVAESQQHIARQLAVEVFQQPGLTDELTTMMKDMTFNALVYQRPGTLIKQVLQPELVLAAEIGPVYVEKGRLNKVARSIAKKEIRKLMPGEAEGLKELQVEYSRPLIQKAVKVSNKLAFFKGAYLKSETENRITSYAASYLHMKDAIAAKNTTAAMEGLLEGEKLAVSTLLDKGQLEDATRLYAKYRTRRANFAYSLADTPELYASKYGRLIPFTTWNRNMLMRLAGDTSNLFKSGNRVEGAKMLAKRLLVPLLPIALFQVVTGHQLMGMHPVTSSVGGLSGQALPSFTQPLAALAQKGPGAAFESAVKFTPFSLPFDAFGKYSEGNSFLESFANMTPLDGDFVERVSPRIFGKYGKEKESLEDWFSRTLDKEVSGVERLFKGE